MRRIAWSLLVLFVFAIPWEYSLEFGAPYGHIARVLGLLTALAAVPAVLQAGSLRKVSAIHWVALALYLWFCCTFFWTLTPQGTLAHLRGYAQEMILLWLVWEFVETAEDLCVFLRAWLAGTWVLAILTIASFVFSDGYAGDQVRFVAIGQDPNDAARSLAFGFPIAGLMLDGTESRGERVLWLCYFPAGFAGVMLSASRSGLLISILALAVCGVAGLRRHWRGIIVAGLLMSLATLLMVNTAPAGTIDRLRTTRELWKHGDLNQRVNIWHAGWQAFENAPFIGHGAGSFATAAELGPEDTAHNTILSILVEGGLLGATLALIIVALSARAIFVTPGRMRSGLLLLLLVLVLSSVTGTVWENRTTWLLFGIAAACQRLAETSGVTEARSTTRGPRLSLDDGNVSSN